MRLRCLQSDACWEQSFVPHLCISRVQQVPKSSLTTCSLFLSVSAGLIVTFCLLIVFFLRYTRSSLIFFWQIYPPVFSLVIKSCQAEVGLHSIIPRSSHIWCSPEESRHNTHHLLSAKYVGEFCRIFTQSHSVPFINYHIIKEAHLLCMVCCLGARSNSLL